MNNYIKVNNVWNRVAVMYRKENYTWIQLTQADYEGYITSHLFTFGGIIDVGGHTLEIEGPSNVSGVSCSFTAIYDNIHDVTTSATWTIVNGSSYVTLSNGELTILSNANNSSVTIKVSYSGVEETKNLVVTYKSGSSADTETTITTDSSGNTVVETVTVITNSDGSSETNTTSTTYDEDGNTIGSSESNVNTNSNGAYSSTTTNYDGNGNAVSTTNESGDSSNNINTQEISYDSGGNAIVTGYTIDTSNNPNGGESISGGIDTGLIVFDGHDWEATLTAKILFSDITPASTQFPILNVSSRGDDNKLDGAFFLVTRQNSGMGSNVYNENGQQISTTTSSNPTLKWRIQNYLGGSLQNGVDFYYKNGTRPYYSNRFGSKTSATTLTYKMTYTNSNKQLVTEIYNGTEIISKPRSETVVTFSRIMDDITFEIGQAVNVSGVELKTKLEVIEFNVVKII